MAQMSWTITIAKVKGIPIRVHLTFIAFLFALVVPEADSLTSALYELLFLIGIFSCIALHELGHALAASFFDIKTRDIVLYPFGGIAAITKSPTPKAELIIALAGPAVNFVIAFILFFFIDYSLFIGESIVLRLLIANLFLGIFNLIPAIPMDGGRVLRALLQLGGVQKATTIATKVSQLISFSLALIGLYYGRMDLLLVSIIVFIGAIQEQVQAQAQQSVSGKTVSDAMVDRSKLQFFTHATTISDALITALRSFQEYFPVIVGSEVKGIVSKEQLIQYAASTEENSYLQEIIDKNFAITNPGETLSNLLDPTKYSQDTPYFIVKSADETFVGMLLRDKIIEFLLFDELKRRMDTAKTIDQSVIP
jgi:Zn-dependent protease